MKLIYPAVVRQNENGRFEAYMPDLEGCHASADTYDEVMNDLNAAALEWIEVELMEDDPYLPPVSDEEDLVLKEGEYVRLVSLTIRLTDGWDE